MSYLSAQNEAYLAWLNSGSVPTAQGDAFYGSTIPVWRSVIDIRAHGAKGDSNPATDDSVPINAAILAAYNSSRGSQSAAIYIPFAPLQSDGTQGFYNLKHSLIVFDGTTLFSDLGGQWACRLLFNECTGIDVDDNTTLTSDVTLQNLWLDGTAPDSASSAVTIGINSDVTNYWTGENLQVTNFVDGFVFNAQNVGNGNHFVKNYISVNTRYPNAVNGYPRYGIHLLGAGNAHPQSIDFFGMWVSGNLSATSTAPTGNGINTTFNIRPNVPLWQESGIKVYYVNAGGYEVKKSSDPSTGQYKLYDFTTGSNVLIPNGSTGSRSQNVNVVFNTPPANGQLIHIVFNDPTMNTGIQISQGNINSFRGLGIQGCITGVSDHVGQNLFDFDNMEIINLAWQLLGNTGQGTVALARQYGVIDQMWSSSASSGGTLIAGDMGAGWDWFEHQATGNQTCTSLVTPLVLATDVTDTGPGGLKFTQPGFSNREIEATGLVALVASGGGPVSAQFQLKASYDNASTWGVVDTDIVSGYCSVAEENFYARFRCTAVDRANNPLPINGQLPSVFYRTEVLLLSGTSATISGSGQIPYKLRARGVNRANA